MPEPSLADKIALLLRPEAYPCRTTHVELKETHMSCVFLTDRHAWKLKKPAREPYLDFSTIDSRRLNCELEVTLNQRLASDVYEGVVPLFLDPMGGMHLDGETPRPDWIAVDWLVKMQRLPEERMLDRVIAMGVLRREEVQQVGERLAGFYKTACAVSIDPAEYRRSLEADIQAAADVLRKTEYGLPQDAIKLVVGAQLELLHNQPEIFDDRVRQGMVVDAHGDLRPEHICLEQRPVIIDCLEFNAQFRMLDRVSELAFLALECERMGAAWVGGLVFAIYERQTGDHAPPQLLDFYRRQHALTRAKVAVWHIEEDGGPQRTKWISRAKDYLFLAGQSVKSMSEPPV